MVSKTLLVNVSVVDMVTISKDEFPRAGCTVAALEKLRPCFVTDGTGTVTAGSSSGQSNPLWFCGSNHTDFIAS